MLARPLNYFITWSWSAVFSVEKVNILFRNAECSGFAGL